jgi:hypothetical protein
VDKQGSGCTPEHKHDVEFTAPVMQKVKAGMEASDEGKDAGKQNQVSKGHVGTVEGLPAR